MTNQPTTHKYKLLEAALASYREEYRDLADDWKGLETKAQGSVAVAGIFLAALFAFVRELTANSGPLESVLLAVAVLTLLVSVGYAIAALRIRDIAASPLGKHLKPLVQHLLATPDLEANPDRATNFLNDHIRMWHETNENMHHENDRKAGHVLRSQVCLMAAIAAVAILTVVKIAFFS